MLTEYIWSPKQIENLLRHSSKDIRQWAIRKALELYPDTLGDRVIDLIPASDDETRRLILVRLAEADLPFTNTSPLIKLTQDQEIPEFRAVAGAILLRSGYEQLPPEIEVTSISACTPMMFRTERGFNLLLTAYARSKSDNENQPVLLGIARACNFTGPLWNLFRAEDNKALEKEIEYFRELWTNDIPHLEQLNQPGEIITALDQALTRTVPADDTPWKQELLAELEQDRARLRAVRDIAAARTSQWSSKERPFLLASIICLWRNAVCSSRLVEAGDAAGIWRALTLKPWRGVPCQELKDFWLSKKPDELLKSLSGVLLEDYIYGDYSFDVLNTLDTPGRFELFLAVFEGKKYAENVADEAGEALRKAGVPAVDFIIAQFPQLSESLRFLIPLILHSFPTPRVVDFCLEHFEDYMLGKSPNEFVGLLENIGSHQFLAPLLREWKPGEVMMGRTIKLLSEIHNIQDKQIDRVVRDFQKRQRTPEEALEKPITMYPLRCTQCGHTYNYEISKIYVNEKEKRPTIGDVIQCKGCGSLETYEMTSETELKCLAEMMRLTVATQVHPEKDASISENTLKII